MRRALKTKTNNQPHLRDPRASPAGGMRLPQCGHALSYLFSLEPQSLHVMWGIILVWEGDKQGSNTEGSNESIRAVFSHLSNPLLFAMKWT